MERYLLIIKFFAGLALIFASGKLIGHIFRLDDYLRNQVPKNHKG